MFIVDFDDTLFDTQGYHRACYEALADLNISREDYWKSYYENRTDEKGHFAYNDERHANGLAKMGFDRNAVVSKLRSVGQTVKDFLFSDAHDFLETIKGLGKPVYLLTWGLPDYQCTRKVEPSGITHHFCEVLYTREPKEQRLAELFKNNQSDEIWFINDKPEETERLAKLFPQLRPILKVSPVFPEEVYAQLGFPYFKTLTEIKDYIISQVK